MLLFQVYPSICKKKIAYILFWYCDWMGFFAIGLQFCSSDLCTEGDLICKKCLKTNIFVQSKLLPNIDPYCLNLLTFLTPCAQLFSFSERTPHFLLLDSALRVSQICSIVLITQLRQIINRSGSLTLIWLCKYRLGYRWGYQLEIKSLLLCCSNKPKLFFLHHYWCLSAVFIVIFEHFWFIAAVPFLDFKYFFTVWFDSVLFLEVFGEIR